MECYKTDLQYLVRPVQPGDRGGLDSRENGQIRVEIIEAVQQGLKMYNENRAVLHINIPSIYVLTFMMAIKCVMSLHLYFISKPFFSRVTFVLQSTAREFHTITFQTRITIDMTIYSS